MSEPALIPPTADAVARFDRPEVIAATDPALLERGCVNVIGLKPLRDRAGAGWPKLRSGIHSRLEAILKRHLGPADFFVPLNDEAYLVTMPAANSDQAKAACLRVASDLYNEYLGPSDLETITLYRV